MFHKLDYSFHSGVTPAANTGVPNMLFKGHGRWAYDKAEEGNVKDNLTELLKVSSLLGM